MELFSNFSNQVKKNNTPIMDRKILLYASLLFLIVLPFFWLRPGEVDLGGDSSRLYFYDPLHYLRSFSLYSFAPSGYGSEVAPFYLIPFVSFILLFKFFLSSPYLVITLFNSFSLATAFFSIYGIIISFLQPEDSVKDKRDSINFIAIICGFFYVFSPLLIHVGWDKALDTHNQFFLNPLIFYLLLQYITKKKNIFIFIALLISFVFAPSFFPSPAFFSFYPLAFLYLLFFGVFLKRKSYSYKRIGLFIFFFFVVQCFQLFPFVSNIFMEGSSLNNTAFGDYGRQTRGVDSFLVGVNPSGPVYNLFGIFQGDSRFTTNFFTIFLILILLGLILSEKLEKKNRLFKNNFFVLVLLLLITMQLATGNFTAMGLEFYKQLFNIPGFGMFQNHYGQFAHVFIFFYALVLGYALFPVFLLIKRKHNRLILFFCLIFTIFIVSNQFIQGKMINRILNVGSKNQVKVPIKMDPVYEDVLSYIRQDPIDNKYLLFPLDDYGYQILSGIDGGAYQGPSTIAYLGEKNQFSGKAGLFGETLSHFTFSRNYEGINNLFALSNIQHIFYNSDPAIYDDTFSGWPNADVRRFMPQTQDIYKDFINLLAVKKEKDFSNLYHVYKVDNEYYLPHIYTTNKSYAISASSLEDYTSLLSFYTDKRLVMYPLDTANSRVLHGLYKKATAVGTLTPFFVKKPDVFSISTSVTPRLYMVLYPLLGLSDKTNNEETNKKLRTFFDKQAYAAENIVGRLKSLSLTTKEFVEGLDNYASIVTTLIRGIENQNNPLYAPTIYRSKLRQMLIADEKSLYNYLHKKNIPNSEREASTNILNKTFTFIYKQMPSKISVENNVNYQTIIPESGIYTVFMNTQDIAQESLSSLKLTVNDKNLLPSTIQQGAWLNLGQIESKNGNKISFSLQNSFFIDNEEKVFADLLAKPDSARYIVAVHARGALLLLLSNMVSNFVNWEQNTVYLVNFDYQISRNSWKTYHAFIETGEDLNSAFLVILDDPSNPATVSEPFSESQDLSIKNFSIVSFQSPKVFLKKEIQQEKNVIPKIIFTKINPTKYEVKVSGAKDPYTLVFLDQFSKNWKLYMTKKTEEKTESITTSYFNGEVTEGMHKNIFLNVKTFETWFKKPIAEDKHFMVNGYANAWRIDPKDTNDSATYTLIIELTTQHQIYPLLFISLSGVGLCIMLLGRSLWKIHKQKNEFN